jgi:hypothetical protein
MEIQVEWFYSEQGRQCGPVNDSALENLLRSGRIEDGTLVWRAGMSEWQPLRTARPLTTASASATLPLAPPGFRAPVSTGVSVCVECQREFPHSEMILLNRSWVCAGCKPIFVQRLKEGAAPPGGNVWRDGREFVLGKETKMPDRCIKCNAPATGGRLKRRFYWHPPGYYLLLLAIPLIYVLFALFITKRATVEIGVCERHRRQRIWTIAGSWMAVIAGIAVFPVAMMNNLEWAVPIGCVLVAGGIAYGVLRSPLVAPSKIDDQFVWLRGGGTAFLESLPEWPGPNNNN